jgi:hypothetical protein
MCADVGHVGELKLPQCVDARVFRIIVVEHHLVVERVLVRRLASQVGHLVRFSRRRLTHGSPALPDVRPTGAAPA